MKATAAGGIRATQGTFSSLTSHPLRCPLHSYQFIRSAESIPSLLLSSTRTSSQVSLACLVSSVQLHLACVPQQSSLCCALRIQTTSFYFHTAFRLWMPSCKRRESELTSSLALTLQIQWIIAWSLRSRRFNVAAVMAHISATCSITLLTHVKYTLPLFTRSRLWSVRR